MMGTSGIVGPCILQAAGAGYSFKLLKTDHVARGVLRRRRGEQRRVPRGAEHGGIWKLPVLFVCENNQFATEVPFAYAAGNPSVASRGGGLRHARRRGRWQRRARRCTQPPAKRCGARATGGGPTLIECKTYRTRPHAEGMGDYTYRTREEVEEWKATLPDRAAPRRSCSTDKIATEAELDAIDAEVAGRRGSGARSLRRGSPLPDAATADDARVCRGVRSQRSGVSDRRS